MTFDEQAQLMRGFRNEGYIYTEIAWLFDVDRATVSRGLIQSGVPSGFCSPATSRSCWRLAPRKYAPSSGAARSARAI